MKTRKLLKALGRLFDHEGRKLDKVRDEIEELLDRLRDKRHKLEKKIRHEKNTDERKRLEQKLATIDAQIDKGAEKLADIEARLERD